MPNKHLQYILFLVCFLTVLLVHGQNQADSLKNLLANTSDKFEKADITQQIGETLLDASPEIAMQYYQSAKVLAEELQDTSLLLSCLLGICDVHSTFDENKNALNVIYEALDLAKNDYESLALCYNRLSIIYFQLGDPLKSVESDKQSLKYNRLLNDSAGIAFDMHNIGTFYMENDQLDSAIYYYQSSNLIAQNVDKLLPIYNTSRMGLIYFRTQQYDLSIKQQLLAIKAFDENKMLIPLANEQSYLAETYLKLNSFEKATEYAEKSLKLSNKLSHTGLLIKNYTILMQISKEKKEFEKALEYSLLVKTYSDSIAAKNNTNLIQNIEAKHKYTQQKRLLELSEAKNGFLLRQKRLYSILAILSILIFIIGATLIYILLRNHNKTQKLLQKLNFANTSQKKLLSLTGHDLRNSVGTIKGFTDLLSSQEISETEVQELMPKFVTAVDSSYDLLENLVTWGKHSQEGLKPDIQKLNSKQLIERTIKHVQQLARLKNISIDYDNENIEFNGDRNMILTLIRNLVSNSIKFSQPGTSITIRSYKKDNYINFSVTDQGSGLSPEDIEKVLNPKIEFNKKGTLNESGSGLGINLCQSFIKEHGGKLTIESELNKGSTFNFTIPSS